MFFIPAWVTNLIFLAVFYLSGFQHVQLKRRNSVMNLQFIMMVWSLAMIVTVAMQNRDSPWLSLAFFLAAVASLALMIRQHRWLPPLKPLQ